MQAGKGVKDLRDYAIANKSYSTGILVMTFLATYYGRDTFIYFPNWDALDAMNRTFFEALLPTLIVVLVIT